MVEKDNLSHVGDETEEVGAVNHNSQGNDFEELEELGETYPINQRIFFPIT